MLELVERDLVKIRAGNAPLKPNSRAGTESFCEDWKLCPFTDSYDIEYERIGPVPQKPTRKAAFAV